MKQRYVQNRPEPKNHKPILVLQLILQCECAYTVNYVRGSGNPTIVYYDCDIHGRQKLKSCEVHR
jgi:hypothetical protein